MAFIRTEIHRTTICVLSSSFLLFCLDNRRSFGRMFLLDNTQFTHFSSGEHLRVCTSQILKRTTKSTKIISREYPRKSCFHLLTKGSNRVFRNATADYAADVRSFKESGEFHKFLMKLDETRWSSMETLWIASFPAARLIKWQKQRMRLLLFRLAASYLLFGPMILWQHSTIET